MQEVFMRTNVVACVALVTLSLTCAIPAHAVGTRHAFCLQGYEYPGLSYCPFDTYEQCQASASGRNLQCVANPFFNGASDDPYAYPNRNRAFPPNYYPAPPNPYYRY
jgi:hypothetical protein